MLGLFFLLEKCLCEPRDVVGNIDAIFGPTNVRSLTNLDCVVNRNLGHYFDCRLMIMCRVITRFQHYPYKRRQFREIKTRQALISIEKITLPYSIEINIKLKTLKVQHISKIKNHNYNIWFYILDHLTNILFFRGPGWLNELGSWITYQIIQAYHHVTNTAWVHARLCKLQKRVHWTRSRKW
jgi:hypothetical protein